MIQNRLPVEGSVSSGTNECARSAPQWSDPVGATHTLLRFGSPDRASSVTGAECLPSGPVFRPDDSARIPDPDSINPLKAGLMHLALRQCVSNLIIFLQRVLIILLLI